MKKLFALLFFLPFALEVFSQGNWTKKADFAGLGREHPVGFAIGGNGYIGTGRDMTGTNHKDFWQYNPQLNIWTQKADFAGGQDMTRLVLQ